ncbi:VIT and VWA domain-containing protein [Uliginosibacterium sp. 31-16]|uniref:VIT and vWA domain-containing protein n=1 Tax=Uliginosibacterium sp. 31-16 TaxID=3068315 RepID=UPI00273E425E|nr:VIT and VWA domain-containing protein [Uliginosibacterium sp. 31-16]MDP5239845.1 VIT and VWA domain-containing protein [Uliginosibacterium sp. 31-16]
MNAFRKSPSYLARLALMLIGLLAGAVAQAAGLLTPSDGSLPSLDLREQHVKVVIEDGYAVTTVEQVFHNPHDKDLEAVYSFPVPAHGAVGEFTMWIDGKPVTGEVLEKQAARQLYEQEKKAGRDAGLTEKDSYKTFDISVSPVRAGKDTRIRLVYFQTAAVDTGIGRYVYPLEEGGVDEEKLAFWTANPKVSGSFSFDLHLKSSYPVDGIRLPNQSQAQVTQVGPGEWKVSLASQGAAGPAANEGGKQSAPAFNPTASNGAAFTLDKDLVVYWRHKAGLPGSVDLVTYKPDASKRGTFMLTVTPGDDLKPITEGSDWIFVLDMSGSMTGKYATLANGVQRAMAKLRPNDRFRIILFNDRSTELTKGYVNATPDMVQRYSAEVAAIKPSNGTNLYAGVQQGLDSIEADRTSSIVLVTDGVANVGETAQRKFIELVKQKDIRLFTMIMGNSANRPLLEALTRASNGFAISISNSDDIVGQLLTAVSKVSHQALHGVQVKINGVKTADLTPKEIGSLYRGQQLVLVGHYWGDGLAKVELTGRISGQPKTYRTEFAFPAKTTANPELERLWAYATIEELQSDMADFGEKADLKRAATDIALEYSLVSDYTSMLVLREDQFAANKIERRNQARVGIEEAARQQRAQTAPVAHRVDTQKPMSSGSRASHSSGGGALDGWSVLALLSLLLTTLRLRRAA